MCRNRKRAIKNTSLEGLRINRGLMMGSSATMIGAIFFQFFQSFRISFSDPGPTRPLKATSPISILINYGIRMSESVRLVDIGITLLCNR